MIMELSKHIFLTLSIIQGLIFHQAGATNSNLFREYIGAEFENVKFSDVPINPNTNFHFILSFAIDYTTDRLNPSTTFGKFNVFWDSNNLSPSAVSSIKQSHSNVRVALSLGGDSVAGTPAFFVNPPSIDYWVANAVSSLTSIIRQYNLDGIDIDYEHFRKASPYTFAECIGRLITTLKRNNVISFASIAPFNGDQVQRHYKELWSRYGYAIDYVNFQFYAYESGTTVPQFLTYFRTQTSNYQGAKILVSIRSAGDGGLSPENGFFTACKTLKDQQQLYGIFIWSAEGSMSRGFQYERQSQALLT